MITLLTLLIIVAISVFFLAAVPVESDAPSAPAIKIQLISIVTLIAALIAIAMMDHV